MSKPYTNIEESDKKIIREFLETTDSEELIWHRDREDRLVKSIGNTDWLIQLDNELPKSLNEATFIPEGMFHRVIKGTGKLVVEIIKVKEGDTIEKYSAKGKATGKLKQGTVRKRLGIKKGEKIPLSKINKELARLRKMDKDKDKPGAQLGDKNQKYSKALNLAKTLKTTTNVNEDDPKTGTGKKPKGSSRRLYTDEDPKDTVGVKFSSRQDIVDTLNKKSFKSKSHARQSQIINLIHQRTRAAYNRAKDPKVKKRLKTALDYITDRKEASKKKTQRLNKKK